MKRGLLLLFAVLCCGLLFAADKIKVACIGDSITFGYGLEDRSTQAYPAHLQHLLGEKYEVRNFGNSGRGIYLHSWRGLERRGFWYTKEHRAALEWQPDIVVCNLGINDCGEFIEHEVTHPGAWMQDYCTLLEDYHKLPTKPKLYIWGKFSPLAPGQPYYRSPEPFLMQAELKKISTVMGARLIDMQEPLREGLQFLFPDQIHPNAEGTRIIAEVTHRALTNEPTRPVTLPEEIRENAETWLCAGQSNMFWPLGRCKNAMEEAAATAKHNIHLWDALTQQWIRITPENALEWSGFALSFAIRRAEQRQCPIAILLVCASGAPTEAFLDECTLAAHSSIGKPLYPNLLQIVTDRRQIDRNASFPSKWCAQEYRRRLQAESQWWGLGTLYKRGIMPIRHLPLTGILWYQGESNATTGIGEDGGEPLPADYMRETLEAIIHELRPSRKTPFVMVGLPKSNRQWAPYRKLQKEVCKDKKALYLDTFKAGLGKQDSIHPNDKISFAKMALDAVKDLP